MQVSSFCASYHGFDDSEVTELVKCGVEGLGSGQENRELTS